MHSIIIAKSLLVMHIISILMSLWK